MDWKKVSKDDLRGQFFVWASGTKGLVGYYETIDRLRPLFKKLQSLQHISGYYVNHICDDTTNNIDTVRFSYFVLSESIPVATEVETFLRENKLNEVYTRKNPCLDNIPLDYRQFLALETQIGLEIMEADLLNAQSLLATYRWQVYRDHLDRRPHFEPTFERDSITYRSLSPEDRDFLWSNLRNYEYAHHLVNLVPGFDERVYSFGEPYSIQRINEEVLKQFSAPFRIYEDWKPQVRSKS